MSRILVTAMILTIAISDTEYLQADETDCNYAWMLASEDGSKPSQEMIDAKNQREADCRQRKTDSKKEADNARVRLGNEFDVDAGDMTDQEAVRRLAEEVDQKRRDDEEEADLRADQADRARASDINQMMDRQDKMLQGLGVSMNTGDNDDDYADEDEYEDDIDPIELQMYQRMVDGGAAPQCKGRTGAALIDCVDEALDEDE